MPSEAQAQRVLPLGNGPEDQQRALLRVGVGVAVVAREGPADLLERLSCRAHHRHQQLRPPAQLELQLGDRLLQLDVLRGRGQRVGADVHLVVAERQLLELQHPVARAELARLAVHEDLHLRVDRLAPQPGADDQRARRGEHHFPSRLEAVTGGERAVGLGEEPGAVIGAVQRHPALPVDPLLEERAVARRIDGHLRGDGLAFEVGHVDLLDQRRLEGELQRLGVAGGLRAERPRHRDHLAPQRRLFEDEGSVGVGGDLGDRHRGPEGALTQPLHHPLHRRGIFAVEDRQVAQATLELLRSPGPGA